MCVYIRTRVCAPRANDAWSPAGGVHVCTHAGMCHDPQQSPTPAEGTSVPQSPSEHHCLVSHAVPAFCSLSPGLGPTPAPHSWAWVTAVGLEVGSEARAWHSLLCHQPCPHPLSPRAGRTGMPWTNCSGTWTPTETPRWTSASSSCSWLRLHPPATSTSCRLRRNDAHGQGEAGGGHGGPLSGIPAAVPLSSTCGGAQASSLQHPETSVSSSVHANTQRCNYEINRHNL